ncbi:deoxyuridine 5'-triphosphate nucleotidohydrolase-like [Centruroides sculpturatus]|uniref:deoxyuridine 5'-triphosphate nucleotidohydrolase-like n=1 Tax=Centruroides sculpturatus TaxID=218467 RepID=UPI000C6E0D8D|nr:deoxyuridine 5'-triphosphate nucleotidohydrolase-like [Centruroides sculpturatus]
MASSGAAGYDIFCTKGFQINPHEQKVIFTDIALEIPMNCYARIAPKSSISLNNIMINAGVIDFDYRGNIGVVMYNYGSETIIFEKGLAIAQIIFELIMHPSLIEKTDSLNATDRNEKGFREYSKIAFKDFEDSEEESDITEKESDISEKENDDDEITLSHEKEEEDDFNCDEDTHDDFNCIDLSQKIDCCNEIILSEKEDFGDCGKN